MEDPISKIQLQRTFLLFFIFDSSPCFLHVRVGLFPSDADKQKISQSTESSYLDETENMDDGRLIPCRLEE